MEQFGLRLEKGMIRLFEEGLTYPTGSVNPSEVYEIVTSFPEGRERLSQVAYNLLTKEGVTINWKVARNSRRTMVDMVLGIDHLIIPVPSAGMFGLDFTINGEFIAKKVKHQKKFRCIYERLGIVRSAVLHVVPPVEGWAMLSDTRLVEVVVDLDEIVYSLDEAGRPYGNVYSIDCREIVG